MGGQTSLFLDKEIFRELSHVAAVVLAPLTTHLHMQAELVEDLKSEDKALDVSPS